MQSGGIPTSACVHDNFLEFLKQLRSRQVFVRIHLAVPPDTEIKPCTDDECSDDDFVRKILYIEEVNLQSDRLASTVVRQRTL